MILVTHGCDISLITNVVFSNAQPLIMSNCVKLRTCMCAQEYYVLLVLLYVFDSSSCYRGCLSIVQCRQGSLEFRTDNLSTLTVLKDFLSKEATEKNIAVKINYGKDQCSAAVNLLQALHWSHSDYPELNQDSVPHMLTLVYPLLEQQLMLAKNVQLIDALQVR